MQQEIKALEKNGTWSLTSMPLEKLSLGSKWVFQIKYKVDKTIERYMVLLVILGNKQTRSIDFTEIFALLAKMVNLTFYCFCSKLVFILDECIQCISPW